MNLIDPLYCLFNSRIDYSDETRISKSGEDIANWSKENAGLSLEGHKNFVTEMFFATHHAMHLGMIPTISLHFELLQSAGRMQAKRNELLQSKPTWSQVRNLSVHVKLISYRHHKPL